MSAQAAAAFLSSSSRSSTASSVEADNSKQSPPPAKYTSTWKQQKQAESMDTKNNNPTTTKAIEELSRIRAGGSGGVASILSKFAAPPDRVPVKQQQQQRQQQQQQQRPASPSKSTVAYHDKRPSSPQQQSSAARQQQLASPAPQPRATTTEVPARYRDRTASDMLAQELSAMYQEALDQYSAAQERLKELERDVEVYASDATKVRDYEIRVEYLAQKLEQISEERDALEQELKMYRERHGTLDTPTSPVFNQRLSQLFGKDRSEAGDKEGGEEHHENGEQEAEEENDGEFYGLLDAYGDDEGEHEERVSIQEDNRSSRSSHQSNPVSHRQLEALKKQLRACDEGAKMAMQQYVATLERERLESKALRDVVRKQDELIHTLEQQITSGKNDATPATPVASRPPRGASLAISTDKKLQPKDMPPMPANASSTQAEYQQLREQLESQGRELEDKRALLTQLLNEREEYMKQSGRSNASSIDVLAEMAKPPARSHSRNNNSANTPPPSAPPRDPLPPVPAHQLQNVMSPSKSSRGSMASLHDESGLSSSVTSWSSSDFGRHMHKQQHQQQHHPQPKANEFENMYANYLQEGGNVADEDENAALEHHREALRRLENTHVDTKKPTDAEPFWHSLMA
ncbi:hypothetical protein BCR43DRAFT_488978 [Syncephalastrum racemosum]|uniref:Uncharacterized protein n=1 Tax=Syncephalastrum racemosum TaxID=13706 RepID=A0A1X2HJN6_SYNRA|nr:hypothetical protein BCR43DRAFT_488978 [Syncephalastrum racemosum]